VAVLNPYRGIVRLLIECFSIISRCRHPVPSISRPVRSGDEPRAESAEQAKPFSRLL
jgi:hypothetical protein